MTIPLVFNELCLRITAPDKPTAQQWMADFVRTLMAANDANLIVFRTVAHFGEMLLAPNYPMQAWFNDGEVSREWREYILTYATRYSVIKPPLHDLPPSDEIVVRSERFLCTFEAQDAIGLGYAFLLGGLAISLLTEAWWDAEQIMVQRIEEELETGTIVEDSKSVRHLGRSVHVDLHRSWILEQQLRSVRDGKALWQKTKQWYPHLIFCDRARRQIQDLHRADSRLPQIVNRLFDLENFCKQWQDDGFDINLIQSASDETPETKRQFGEQRVFVFPDGQQRPCYFHLKGIEGHWRIHIWPDIEFQFSTVNNRRIFVCYVGSHLDVPSYNS